MATKGATAMQVEGAADLGVDVTKDNFEAVYPKVVEALKVPPRHSPKLE